MDIKTLKNIKEFLPLPELYEKYSIEIFKYSLSILNNEEEAKDAVQEVFVKYANSKSSFRQDCSQKTWLLVITRNYCYNRLQHSSFKNYGIEEVRQNENYEIDYDSNISLKEALKMLTPEQNELIYLKEYEGYSYKEIAELTNQSLENVKIKLFRVRKRLREILK
ncbi:MAG: RNA polymerase sigma factor [Ignavibacteriae bacterium]|nr:RNA polymerase sigma factor [Ignavibacteriota bacterium]NOG99873.1 RNA polymerase sigma factor [Ignavibacteriota bacterium]